MGSTLFDLAVVVRAVDQLTGPVKNMAASVSNLQTQLEKSRAMVDYGNKMTVSGALVQGAADQSRQALSMLAEPVMEVETAMGEMSSVGIKNMDALLSAATRFSSQWSGTTEAQFISSAYDIKGGIESLSDTAVAEYTRMSALTGKATKSTTDEMTSLFATGYGIYKNMYSDMSDLQFGEMFSAGLTGAVQQFKSDGSNMSQALTTLGATATSAGIAMEEQFSILGMLQATMPGGESGTKYRAFLQSAARAGKSLGLSFVDANNQLLGTTDILDKLRGKYGETLDAMEAQEIQKAFGSDEAMAMINLLYPKVGELRDNIDSLGQTMQQGTVYTEGIARAMNTGLGEQMGVVSQNMQILKRSIGTEMSPLIKAAIPDIIKMATGFKGFAQAHPTLVRSVLLMLLLGTAALSIIAPILLIGGSFMIMGGYFMLGVGKIAQGFGLLKDVSTGAFSVLKGGVKILTRILPALASGLWGCITAVWSFTAALLANPITWIVIGIIALVAVIYLLWRNWDKVSAAMGKGWDWLMKKFDQGKQWFAGIFQGIIGLARQYGPMILAVLFPVIGIPLLIAQHWDTIKTVVPAKITELVNNIRGKIADFRASGAALLQAFVAGIKSVINKPVELVKTGLAKLRRLLPHSDAKEGPLSTLTSSGMALINTFASGIQKRSPYLQAVTQSAFGGINIPTLQPAFAGAPGRWETSPLGRVPGLNMREVFKETTRERESVYTRDRRPIVVVMQHPGGQSNYEDVVDLALRQFEMRGGNK